MVGVITEAGLGSPDPNLGGLFQRGNFPVIDPPQRRPLGRRPFIANCFLLGVLRRLYGINRKRATDARQEKRRNL